MKKAKSFYQNTRRKLQKRCSILVLQTLFQLKKNTYICFLIDKNTLLCKQKKSLKE